MSSLQEKLPSLTDVGELGFFWTLNTLVLSIVYICLCLRSLQVLWIHIREYREIRLTPSAIYHSGMNTIQFAFLTTFTFTRAASLLINPYQLNPNSAIPPLVTGCLQETAFPA
eukprot:276913_1